MLIIRKGSTCPCLREVFPSLAYRYQPWTSAEERYAMFVLQENFYLANDILAWERDNEPHPSAVP